VGDVDGCADAGNCNSGGVGDTSGVSSGCESVGDCDSCGFGDSDADGVGSNECGCF